MKINVWINFVGITANKEERWNLVSHLYSKILKDVLYTDYVAARTTADLAYSQGGKMSNIEISPNGYIAEDPMNLASKILECLQDDAGDIGIKVDVDGKFAESENYQ